MEITDWVDDILALDIHADECFVGKLNATLHNGVAEPPPGIVDWDVQPLES